MKKTISVSKVAAKVGVQVPWENKNAGLVYSRQKVGIFIIISA